MRIGKLIGTIVILVLVFVVVTLFISYRNFRKSLPRQKGTIELSGLREPVEIYRDPHGIPHIFANNDDDLYFAAGYVTAQDRLWQLELSRRIANGQLSSMLGDTTVAADRLLHTLGFKRIGQKLSSSIPDRSHKIFSAYVKGINTYIQQHKGEYPFEFLALDCEPGLWQVENCLAFSRLTAWRLSFAWYTELLTAQILTKLGTEKTKELFCEYSSQWPLIVPSEVTQLSHALESFRRSEELLSSLTGLHAAPSIGSNSWVVAPSKSQSQQAILANDPHLPLTNPSCWYIMHLVTPEVNVAGFSLPGSPGIVIGFNEHIAWGLTNAMADDADFYIETINPINPNQYWYNGHWEEMQTITDTIVIKNKPSQFITIRLTKHGPVVSDIHPQLSARTGFARSKEDSSLVVSMRWTGQESSDEGLAVYLLNRARNWREFRKAIRHFKVPVQNILYADRRGNIGYWCAGAIPIRKNGQGFLPFKINPDHNNTWLGSIPFEKLPHLYNPQEGFIAIANNKIAPDSYPYYISILWEPSSRIERIREFLHSKERFSEEDFKLLQTDLLSPFTRKVMQFILPIITKEKQHNESFQAIYPYLKGWDFHMRGESTAAAIFEVFLNHLLKNVFQDELGKELYCQYIHFPSLPIRALGYIIEEKKWSWFDNVTTTLIETPSEIVRQSLIEALAELKQKLGKNMAKWRWDKLHTVTFRHFLGEEKWLGKLLNVGPLPMAGSYTTVFNGGYDFNHPYSCIVGPSMRMIHDFAHPGETWVINPPGQIAHPLSSHFKDQADLWLNGLYIHLISDTTEVRRSLSGQDGWGKLQLLSKQHLLKDLIF